MSREAPWVEKAFKLDRFDTVIKVGGSVIDSAQLPIVVESLELLLASGARCLVVPGGGSIDNYLESYHERLPLESRVFHEATLLAQDQTGLLLTNASRKLTPARSIWDATRQSEAGTIPVLLPSELFRTIDVFRHTNRVSSDSMALWLCSLLRVETLVLIKSRRVAHRRSAEELTADPGFVDETFPFLMASSPQVVCHFATAGDGGSILTAIGLALPRESGQDQ